MDKCFEGHHAQVSLNLTSLTQRMGSVTIYLVIWYLIQNYTKGFCKNEMV